MRNIIFAAVAITVASVLMVPSPDAFEPGQSKDRPTKARKQQRSSGGDVVLPRRGGHFYAEVEVNGTSIDMMADTGATVVALSVEDAEAAGINVDGLRFNGIISTANGQASAAAVLLDEVTVGSITRSNVRALVARELPRSLLGMSFFNSLSKVSIESNEMVLED
jgi:aspartyl protease family protein